MELSYLAWCVAAVIGAWPYSSAAYPTPVDFSGDILRWNITAGDGPIYYEIVGDDADVALYSDFIDDAAQLWSSVDTSYFRYESNPEGYGPDVTINLERRDDDSGFSSGFASFDKRNKDETVAHCKVTVFVDNNLTVSSFRKTALHELGHCLGLGHSLIPESIMSYNLGKNGFALDTDDIAAITRLYPADGSEPSLPPGCGIGGSRGTYLGLWALLMPLLLPSILTKQL
tara:strand:+ start:251 stop:937 length:687 start_codon:yes stop_codon:yes gene_type:complete